MAVHQGGTASLVEAAASVAARRGAWCTRPAAGFPGECRTRSSSVQGGLSVVEWQPASEWRAHREPCHSLGPVRARETTGAAANEAPRIAFLSSCIPSPSLRQRRHRSGKAGLAAARGHCSAAWPALVAPLPRRPSSSSCRGAWRRAKPATAAAACRSAAAVQAARPGYPGSL